MWRFMNHAALFGVSLGYLPTVFFFPTQRQRRRGGRSEGLSQRVLVGASSNVRALRREKKSLNV